MSLLLVRNQKPWAVAQKETKTTKKIIIPFLKQKLALSKLIPGKQSQ